MDVQIRKRPPVMEEALPYVAIIATRDGRGVLVGARVLRARTDDELDRKIEQLRGANARDDLATMTDGPTQPKPSGPSDAPKG